MKVKKRKPALKCAVRKKEFVQKAGKKVLVWKWVKDVPVTSLIGKGATVRCNLCQGRIRLHRAGPNGEPRAHAEHRRAFEGCPYSYIYDWKRKRTNPNAVRN